MSQCVLPIPPIGVDIPSAVVMRQDVEVSIFEINFGKLHICLVASESNSYCRFIGLCWNIDRTHGKYLHHEP